MLGSGSGDRLVTMAVRNRERRDREISYYMALGRRNGICSPRLANRVTWTPGWTSPTNHFRKYRMEHI